MRKDRAPSPEFEVDPKLQYQIDAATAASKGAKTKDIPCPVVGCSYTFQYNREVKTHVKRHHPDFLNQKPPSPAKKTPLPAAKITEYNFKCPVEGCNALFQFRTQLKQHITNIHQDYHYQCPYCPNTYTTHDGLLKHIRKHAGKHFQCEYCRRWFENMFELKEHVTIHTGEQKYKCAICGKKVSFQKVSAKTPSKPR